MSKMIKLYERHLKILKKMNPPNCGVNLTGVEKSKQKIKNYLHVLEQEGKGDSFLAQVYKKILETMN